MEPYNDIRAASELGGHGKEVPSDMHSILRGEISAVQSYRQVLEMLRADPEAHRLEEFVQDHEKAVSYWTDQIGAMGDQPDRDSGVWGSVVEAFTGSAKLMGNTSAIQALKQGEVHGLNEYRDLLENENVTEAQKQFIRETLIPNQERHITSIDAMMKLH